MSSKSQLIRTIYLYAVSLITLVIIIISASSLVNLGLKTWVFTRADRPEYFNSYPVAPVGIDGKTIATSTLEEQARAKKDQEEQYQIQKQTEAVRSFSMLLVAVPVFLFHWRLARKDKEEKEN